jgi:hypothetical protein
MPVAVSRWSIRRPVLVVVLWLAAVAASFTVGIGVFDRLGVREPPAPHHHTAERPPGAVAVRSGSGTGSGTP